MKVYKSAAVSAEVSITIKKSVFVCRVFPTDTQEKALSLIENIKEENRDAAHNVYAMQVGIDKVIQKVSDDGEPGGTAGKPILEVIRQNGITNTTIVVSRYFGGIKLGAGGLIRAYSRAARKGIEKAGIVSKAIHKKYEITVNYSHIGSARAEMAKWGKILDTDYKEKATFTVLVAENASYDFIGRMIEITNNDLQYKQAGECFSKIQEQ